LLLYDPDGNLVKKIKPDGSKTLYVGGIYEVDKTSGGTVTGTKTYYPAAGAMRIGGTLYYMLKDHLGSASVLTDASGNIVTGADTRYYPFGEARFSTSPMLTDKLFTGQREITGLGIYYYGARFYSPKLGRFLSADSIVPGYINPQNLNRFSYVNNNPLRYTDPTGHMMDDGCSIGCGYTPPPSTNYCTTHPGACGNTNHNGSNHNSQTPTPTTTNDLHVTIPSLTATLPINGTPLPQQCTNIHPCIGNFVPSATPTPTNTPYNVLATVGANIDIAANTAVAGGVNYCLHPDAQGCGETVDNAFASDPRYPHGLGHQLDAYIETGNIVGDAAQNSLPTQSQQSLPLGSEIIRDATIVGEAVTLPAAVYGFVQYFLPLLLGL
jgi:RHS repeat-associated protein